MAIDPEFQKKLQIFLVAAIVIAGGRAAYIVYERHEALKETAEAQAGNGAQGGLLRHAEEVACL
jgi:hypothetical protein